MVYITWDHFCARKMLWMKKIFCIKFFDVDKLSLVVFEMLNISEDENVLKDIWFMLFENIVPIVIGKYTLLMIVIYKVFKYFLFILNDSVRDIFWFFTIPLTLIFLDCFPIWKIFFLFTELSFLSVAYKKYEVIASSFPIKYAQIYRVIFCTRKTNIVEVFWSITKWSLTFSNGAHNRKIFRIKTRFDEILDMNENWA